MSERPFDEKLIAAYQQTRYRVFVDEDVLDLIIGEHNERIDALLARHHVIEAAFLTACNPRSQLLSETENHARQAKLMEEINAEGYEFLPGVGIGMNSDWPPEESVLVLGIDRTTATELAIRHDQNAHVHVAINQTTELVLRK